MERIVIKEATIINPSQDTITYGDILISEGHIVETGREITAKKGDRVINAQDKYAVPGFVDLQVNPGQGFAESARLLALAGVTTPLFMACNTYNGIPLVDSYGGIEKMIDACNNLAVNAALAIPLEPPDTEGHETYVCLRCEFKDIEKRVIQLKKAGITAIGEVVLPLNGIAHITSNLAAETLDRLIDACQKEDIPILVHTGLGLEGILGAIRIAGNRPMHLCHVGSTCAQDSINAAISALANSPGITSDTHLSEFAGTTSRNSQIMLDAFKRGLVYKVDSETWLSSKVRDLEKEDPPYYYSKPNLFENNLVSALSDTITAIESDDLGDGIRVAMMTKNVFALSRLLSIPGEREKFILKLVRKMTINPARILGIEKGTLNEGAEADVVVVDRATGKVEFTIVRGKVVVDNSRLTGESPGRFIKRASLK